MYLSCNHGVIDVRSAWYGRDRSGVCSERGSTENTNCYTGATSYVSGECDGRSYCSLYVSNSAFGDPCVGTVKYLTVGSKFEEQLKVYDLQGGTLQPKFAS